MAYLKQLYVENFKSWRGEQVIPFKRFNSIIGQNGSGKSNVMDALGFAMGERAAALRVKHTRELIHGAHIGRPVSNTASVTMRFCHDDGEERAFTRRISGSSSEYRTTTSYRINDRYVSQAKYTEELEKIGIVTKARNCLVFQGELESITNPKERTKMFERISQSLDLAEEYDRKKQALQEAKEETQFQFEKKKTITNERKQVSQEKVELDSESSCPATMDVYEREARMVIDYSGLPEELKGLAGEEVEGQLERLAAEASCVDLALQRSTVPNLKALDRMREVRDRFQLVTDAFEASTKAARQRHQEFEEVKARRFRLFSQCFEHVSTAIDQIYKQLCRNTSAQAILSAENPEEPYLDGINYHCVAPGKRFMAMDNLSGGEKAIAALALVFAIHSFRPAPFFVLDEVDAALDNTNIGKVTSFIRDLSRENLQIIVISLKEEFYSRSDLLLGVYSKFNDCMFSRMLTFDLTPQPLNEDNEQEGENAV